MDPDQVASNDQKIQDPSCFKNWYTTSEDMSSVLIRLDI